MKRPEIIFAFRSHVNDVALPYLWSDLEAIGYADDATREAAIRARLIRDSSTPSICTLAFTSPIDALAATDAAVTAATAAVDAADLVITALANAPSTAAMVEVVESMAAVVSAHTAATLGQATAALVAALVTATATLTTKAAALAVTTTTLGDAGGIAAAASVTAASATMTAAVATASTVTLARGDVALSELVLDVLRARLDGQVQSLNIASVEQMDLDSPGWESQAYGLPTCLVTERTGQSLTARLWPIPVTSGTLLLTVNRLPLTNLTTDASSPEIPTQYHMRLIDWMVRQALLKPDAETFDADGAARAEKRFIDSFGVFEDANVQRKHAERRTNQVMFREF